ncbi:MAG TPA: amidohydrolase [Bacteroidia bacterium]|nr:amidohydrolase [Bacteroidia bacterium]
MENLSVTLIQTSLVWENAEANISNFDKLVKPIQKTDIIILPEMFTTGFTMQPAKNAEPINGQGLQWMKQKAVEKNCAITGSICVEGDKKFYNRLYWVEPSKQQQYNKRHLFRMGEEDQHYTMGTEKIISTIKGWKILPLVCYDLRFPVWSRNKWQQKNNELVADYDVLIYVANWPEARNYPWKQLLIARAIENQCYVVGVNRIGADGNGFSHSGDSVVINPLGQIISHTKANEESTETVELDYTFLTELRKKFPVGLDADHFKIIK